MRRHASFILVAVVMATLMGCISSTRASAPKQTEEASSDTHASCLFDEQCPNGSCRLGKCSPLPPEHRKCMSDSDCPGGSCSPIGHCSILPPSDP